MHAHTRTHASRRRDLSPSPPSAQARPNGWGAKAGLDSDEVIRAGGVLPLLMQRDNREKQSPDLADPTTQTRWRDLLLDAAAKSLQLFSKQVWDQSVINIHT